jgi:hypothetical protein
VFTERKWNKTAGGGVKKLAAAGSDSGKRVQMLEFACFSGDNRTEFSELLVKTMRMAGWPSAGLIVGHRWKLWL